MQLSQFFRRMIGIKCMYSILVVSFGFVFLPLLLMLSWCTCLHFAYLVFVCGWEPGSKRVDAPVVFWFSTRPLSSAHREYFPLYSSPARMGRCTDLIFVSPDFVSQPPIHSIYLNLMAHAYHPDLGMWAICSSRTQSRPVCTALGVSVHSLLIHLPTTLTSPNSLHSSRIEHHLDTVSPAVDRRPIDVRLYDIDHFVWRPSTW